MRWQTTSAPIVSAKALYGDGPHRSVVTGPPKTASCGHQNGRVHRAVRTGRCECVLVLLAAVGGCAASSGDGVAVARVCVALRVGVSVRVVTKLLVVVM